MENPAVKYGLAALIGIAGTLLGILIKGIIDARQERRRRRYDILERCARDFEKAAAVFVTLFARYAGYLSPPQGPDDDIQPLAEAKLLEGIWDKITKMIATNVPTALVTLHEIDSSLHLIGCLESSRLVERYRHMATDLQSAIIYRQDINDRVPPSAAEWQMRGKALADARVQVFNHLRSDFQSF